MLQVAHGAGADRVTLDASHTTVRHEGDRFHERKRQAIRFAAK